MQQFTKKAITESFIKLLNNNPLDKITIKDIVEDCGVNRNTFYYYYQDIYALLDELFKAETQKVLEEHREYATWQEGFLKSAEFALKNKKAIYHVYNSISREHLERYLYEITNDMMLSIVKNQASDLQVLEEDIRLVAAFYKFALVGMVLQWLQRGMQDDPEYIVCRMGQLLEGNIRNMLTKADHKIV